MYDLIIHKSLNPEKWIKFATDQQIFMIANEVQRLLTCMKNGLGLETQKERIECALELADLTISVHKGNFRYELLRWREVFGALYLLTENEFKKKDDYVEKLLKSLLQLNSKSTLLLK